MHHALVLTRDSPSRSWGFRFYHLDAFSHGPYVVQRVHAGSPADGKMQPGDKVTHIDGMQLDRLNYNAVTELLKSSNLNISLEIDRNSDLAPAFDSTAPVVEMRKHGPHSQQTRQLRNNTIASDYYGNRISSINDNTNDERFDPIFRSSVLDRRRLFTKSNIQDSQGNSPNSGRFRPLSMSSMKHMSRSVIDPRYDFSWAPSESVMQQFSQPRTQSISTAAALSNANYDEYVSNTFPSDRASYRQAHQPVREAIPTRHSQVPYISPFSPPHRTVVQQHQQQQQQQQQHVFRSGAPLQSFTIQRTLSNVALSKVPRSRSVSQRLGSEHAAPVTAISYQPNHSQPRRRYLDSEGGVGRGASLKINVYDSEKAMHSHRLCRSQQLQPEERITNVKYSSSKTEPQTMFGASTNRYANAEENLVDEMQESKHMAGNQMSRPHMNSDLNLSNYQPYSNTNAYQSTRATHTTPTQFSAAPSRSVFEKRPQSSRNPRRRGTTGATQPRTRGKPGEWDSGVDMHLANPVNEIVSHF